LLLLFTLLSLTNEYIDNFKFHLLDGIKNPFL